MADTESALPYTYRFWAKSEPRHGYPKRIHLLEHHLADVGACFEALLAQPTVRYRLARSGGLHDIDDVMRGRLALLATLHDIGKVNVGFQTQTWRDDDLPFGQRRPAHAGHYNEMSPLINGADHRTAERFFGALGWWWDAAETWDDQAGETLCALFVAVLSHHGQPLQLEGNLPDNPRLWRPVGDLDPVQGVQRISELVRQWFPAAFETGTPPLPPAPDFQHMFLGLCTLADWIGSNQEWFPFCDQPDSQYMDRARSIAEYAIRKVGLDLSGQRAAVASEGPDFSSLFQFSPNAIQRAAVDDTPLNEQLAIIESETGSGKTEAALWRFAHMYREGLVDGLYFALPTRSAAAQLHRRVKSFVENLFPAGHTPPVVLAVPGYDVEEDADSIALEYNSHSAGHREGEERPWASEGPKRYLASQIAVGTVDQAMMAALRVRHAHMRAACLARNLLVVDEVHASDTYMRRILRALLDSHVSVGGYALLMSATLGSVARTYWLSNRPRSIDDAPTLDEAIAAPYPAISVRSSGNAPRGTGENDRQKTVTMTAQPRMPDHRSVAAQALEAARAGAKVLVVRNTVGYAITTQRALEEIASTAERVLLFSHEATLTLHHGRFGPADRRLLDHEVERRLGRDRPPGGMVVVGTQTLEQSLDIDADLLITDLCPVDVLLQRIGRLHRHLRDDRPEGYRDPRCVVLMPEAEDLTSFLRSGPDRNGLGPHGYVYEDLRVLEATRRLVRDFPSWEIPKMNRELVERATHPDPLKQVVEELGEDWLVHANKVTGDELADGLTASQAIIRRDKSFFTDNREVLFPTSMEEKIRTRLGDDRLDVELEPAPPSPLKQRRTIKRLALPLRWVDPSRIDGPARPSLTDDGFTFSIGDRVFHYDRLGLRRV